jgi:hypothetical protein
LDDTKMASSEIAGNLYWSFKPEFGKADKIRSLKFGDFLTGTCNKMKPLGFTKLLKDSQRNCRVT